MQIINSYRVGVSNFSDPNIQNLEDFIEKLDKRFKLKIESQRYINNLDGYIFIKLNHEKFLKIKRQINIENNSCLYLIYVIKLNKKNKNKRFLNVFQNKIKKRQTPILYEPSDLENISEGKLYTRHIGTFFKSERENYLQLLSNLSQINIDNENFWTRLGTIIEHEIINLL